MSRGWTEFIRTPVEQDPRGLIRRHLENRNSHFLDLARRVIFANPSNPYQALFDNAGCRYADLEDSVNRNGLEATLATLLNEGVYLTHDEFKGKTPIRRNGLELAATPADFANPLIRGAIETTSSASRSTGTVTRSSVAFQVYREAQDALFVGQWNPSQRAIVAVLPILPSTVGLHRALTFHRRGTPIEKWFALGGSTRDSGHYRLLTRGLLGRARMLGIPLPSPDYIPRNDFRRVAEWIARQRTDGRSALWMGPVSLGVRVASSALEAGLDIAGTVFLCGAEPLTAARRAAMEAAGGIAYPRYGMSELGWIGCSCQAMDTGSCVHIMRDSIAAIGRRRKASLVDVEVDSLLFTTLLPSAAYVLINVEMDDCGTIEPARCDCEFRRMGFTHQLSNIYSYGKLTGQGITLVGNEMLAVLEKSLPERFGGTPIDYQLVELDGSSVTTVELRVNPRIPVASEDEVRRFFLAEVRRLWGGSLTSRQWGQTDAVRVVRAEPIISGDRKINPLHLLGPSAKPDR